MTSREFKLNAMLILCEGFDQLAAQISADREMLPPRRQDTRQVRQGLLGNFKLTGNADSFWISESWRTWRGGISTI